MTDARLPDARKDVIRLRLTARDLQGVRFAYSPLAEVTESLYGLHSGLTHPVHRGWHQRVASELRTLDTPLLQAVVPATGLIANLLFTGAVDARTSIEDQLECVARADPARLADDLRRTWGRSEVPSSAADLIVAGAGGPPLLAEALERYWRGVIEPWWPQMRSVLDADVAYRAAQLARGGLSALLADLHPDVQLGDGSVDVEATHDSEHDLDGTGILLVPCVFAWPNLIVDPGRTGTASLTYGPRGVGRLWETRDSIPDQDVLSTLLGRARASVLRAVHLPRATTDLARALDQTPSAVSSHLSILRRAGLVTSTRSGRRVVYQQTPLAASLIAGTTTSAESIHATQP